MIAALFVAENGPYFGLPDVDPWPESRDARKYRGPHPVVAHPPCSQWCQLAHINQKRYGIPVGADGGCFWSALVSVRYFGGVLEHPAWSLAWSTFNLPPPKPGRWTAGAGAWVTQVSQRAYGHPAQKMTWLYYVGTVAPPELDWSTPKPVAQISFCKNHGDSPLPRLTKKAASATPAAFRDLLIQIAKQCEPNVNGVDSKNEARETK